MERRAATLSNIGILAVTIVVVSLILTVGRAEPEDTPAALAIGQPSPERFIANRSTTPIVDEEATEAQRQAAAESVETVYTENAEATLAVQRSINEFFEDLQAGAFDDPLPTTTTTTTVAETTTTAAPDDETTTTEQPTTTTEEPTTTTTTLPRKDIDQQVEELAIEWSRVRESTIREFVELMDADLDRIAEGQPSAFPQIVEETRQLVASELAAGIRADEIDEVSDRYLNPLTRPPILIEALPTQEEQDTARGSISELVGVLLQANMTPDERATEELREEERETVTDVTVVYGLGDTIAEAGDPLSAVQFAAIRQLGLYQPEEANAPSRLAMALLGAIAVLLAAFFLWRIAPVQWSRPRHFLLLGVLLALSALISRLPELIADGGSHAIGYMMPAVAVGFMAAILFDPRTAALLAVPMAGFTAISTSDVAFTVFAAVATVIPVAFVSSLASRRQLRLAVVSSAAALAPVAASLEWLFVTDEPGRLLQAAGLAALGGLIAGFIAQGLVSFLETATGITTSLTLLDLLDRNHPALRVLEDKAPGTFNHSMLVGSLAGRAARAIGADALLAQAAAWYHDLGKTAHPQYFAENQFGVSNPHDELPPGRSAEIIRSHVAEGLRLARQYSIPPGVADGIRMHHGTSLMRYFYNRAHAEDPDVDPELFRHHGVEPRQKEMAIVMLSDAVEAGARSYAQNEDPTAEGLVELVDTIVQEKVDDQQLAYTDLTFGDLTRVKAELVRALMGYYHTRVPYPGFPGPRVHRRLGGARPGLPAASPDGGASPQPGGEEESEDEEPYPVADPVLGASE